MAGQPIVETPEDALRCVLLTGIDACVFGDIIVTKSPEYRSPLDLRPVVTGTWVVEHRLAGEHGSPRANSGPGPSIDLFLSASAGRVPDIDELVDAQPRDHLRIIVDGEWGRIIHVVADLRVARLLDLMDGREDGWGVLRAFASAEWRALEPWFRKVLARLVRGSVVELREHAVESAARPPAANRLSLAS